MSTIAEPAVRNAAARSLELPWRCAIELDAKARRAGQIDRFGLLLPRAMALCGVVDQGPITAIELGSGDGSALRYNRPGLTRLAVDAADSYSAELANQGIEFHVCDISKQAIPVPAGSVDLIMMNHVIEHIVDPGHLMSECRRALRSGGGLYLRTPDIAGVGHMFWDDYTHVRPYTAASICALARVHGFVPRTLLASDYTRICLDLLTDGRLRSLLFWRTFLGLRVGGAEIEAAFCRE